jgi:hypothetical protein
MQAAQFDPNFEDPWLILATLSSPRASVAYLQRALEINPRSERAIKGMQWALDRLGKVNEKQQSEEKHTLQAATVVPPSFPQQPIAAEPVLPAKKEAVPAPPPVEELAAEPSESFLTDADLWRQFQEQESQPTETTAEKKEKTQPIRVKPGKKAKAEKKKGAGTTCATLVIIFGILLAFVVALWFALPSWLALMNSASAALPADVLAKPSLTPTNTPTPTPTLPPPLP